MGQVDQGSQFVEKGNSKRCDWTDERTVVVISHGGGDDEDLSVGLAYGDIVSRRIWDIAGGELVDLGDRDEREKF
jgi:hypothetical protein